MTTDQREETLAYLRAEYDRETHKPKYGYPYKSEAEYRDVLVDVLKRNDRIPTIEYETPEGGRVDIALLDEEPVKLIEVKLTPVAAGIGQLLMYGVGWDKPVKLILAAQPSYDKRAKCIETACASVGIQTWWVAPGSEFKREHDFCDWRDRIDAITNDIARDMNEIVLLKEDIEGLTRRIVSAQRRVRQNEKERDRMAMFDTAHEYIKLLYGFRTPAYEQLWKHPLPRPLGWYSDDDDDDQEDQES